MQQQRLPLLEAVRCQNDQSEQLAERRRRLQRSPRQHGPIGQVRTAVLDGQCSQYDRRQRPGSAAAQSAVRPYLDDRQRQADHRQAGRRCQASRWCQASRRCPASQRCQASLLFRASRLCQVVLQSRDHIDAPRASFCKNSRESSLCILKKYKKYTLLYNYLYEIKYLTEASVGMPSNDLTAVVLFVVFIFNTP